MCNCGADIETTTHDLIIEITIHFVVHFTQFKEWSSLMVHLDYILHFRRSATNSAIVWFCKIRFKHE